MSKQLRQPQKIRVKRRETHYTTDFIYSPEEITLGRRAFFKYEDVMAYCNEKWAGVPIVRVEHDHDEEAR